MVTHACNVRTCRGRRVMDLHLYYIMRLPLKKLLVQIEGKLF